MHPRRHDFFQALQYLGPRKGLALDEVVQELRLIARAAVLRKVQERLGFGALLVTLGNEIFFLADRCMIASRIEPASDGHRQQQEREQTNRTDSAAPAHPKLPRILV